MAEAMAASDCSEGFTVDDDWGVKWSIVVPSMAIERRQRPRESPSNAGHRRRLLDFAGIWTEFERKMHSTFPRSAAAKAVYCVSRETISLGVAAAVPLRIFKKLWTNPDSWMRKNPTMALYT